MYTRKQCMDFKFMENEGPLNLAHRHPRDSRIFFEEKEHIYLVDWTGDGYYSAAPMSGSSVGKTFFKEFQRFPIARAIASSTNREAKYAGCDTVEKVLKSWDHTRDLGTIMHAMLARFTDDPNSLTLEERAQPEFEQFKAYMEAEVVGRGLEYFQREWFLWGSSEMPLCGSPDVVCVKPPGPKDDTLNLVIIDYKRSLLDIKDRGMGMGLCAALPNNDAVKYGLSVNVYRYLIERFYTPMEYKGKFYNKIRVSDSFLVAFHPGLERYKTVPVDHVENIEEMIKEALAVTIAKKKNAHSISRFKRPRREIAEEDRPGELMGL
jgi:hypothetical protein